MLTRRHLLAGGALATAATAAARAPTTPIAAPAAPFDEDFWAEVGAQFTGDRTLINLNNGGVSPSPRGVHEAFVRYLQIANQAPAYHLWQVLEPGIEAVRRELAVEAGCAPENLAITRNASEGLQIAQLGLDLEPGDEILTTDQDYPRMLDTWRQRVRRDGVVLKTISFPTPASPGDLVARFRDALTPRTRVVHLCHITNLTGQIFPVAEICALARDAGAVSIVDGAHAFAHFPFRIDALGCDFYATSLHKWLFAPVGTGFLYVRTERIAGHWALQPTAETRDGDIRKFEEIGTHPAANHHAVAEALQFHRWLGGARKAARLRWLRAQWTDALRGHPRLRFLTGDDPDWSCGIGAFGVDGLAPGEITSALWGRHRILATPIVHPQVQGVRVTPSVYTTPRELEVFVDAVRALLG
jgi:isopenicillin-N epimerase